MSRKLDAMLLSGTGFSLCVWRWPRLQPVSLEVAQASARESEGGTGFSLCFCSLGRPVKRALVEHPDSYEWLFTKSITG